jgi:riboflavin biosynthesis pyrimidine reductase
LIIDTELKIADAVDPLQLQRPIVFTCVGEDDEDEDEKGKIDADGSNSNGNGKSRQGRWARAQAKLQPLGGQLVRVGSVRDNTKTVGAGSGRYCNLEECLEACKTSLDIHSVLVEGGAGIIQTVLQHDLAHQFIVTISPSFFGGYRSMTSQLDFQRALGEVEVEMVEGDVVVRGTMR